MSAWMGGHLLHCASSFPNPIHLVSFSPPRLSSSCSQPSSTPFFHNSIQKTVISSHCFHTGPSKPPASLSLLKHCIAQHAFLFFPNTSSFFPRPSIVSSNFQYPPLASRLIHTGREFGRLSAGCLAWATASSSSLSRAHRLLFFVRVHTPLASSSPLAPTCCALFCTSRSSLLLYPLTSLVSPSAVSLSSLTPLPVSSASPALHTELCSALLKTFHPSSPPSLAHCFLQWKELHFKRCMIGGPDK